jgi:hypothetical protein
LLQNVDLQATVHLWFPHGGSSQRFSSFSSDIVTQSVSAQQWIRQGGPTFWSVRFSDLNPLDIILFLWTPEVY